MFWIVTLAAAAVVASIARHAIQDHRDAEQQRRDALDEIDGRPRAARALLASPEKERAREVQRDGAPGVALPRDAAGPLPAAHEDRARTR
jgi:hypothetical protein